MAADGLTEKESIIHVATLTGIYPVCQPPADWRCGVYRITKTVLDADCPDCIAYMMDSKARSAVLDGVFTLWPATNRPLQREV